VGTELARLRQLQPAGERAAYAMTHLLDDIAGLIDVSGARSVTLIGHDWGAMCLVFCDAPRPSARAARHHERTAPGGLPRSAAPAAAEAALVYVQFFQLPRLPEFVLGLDGAAPIGWLIALSASDRRRFGPEVLDVYRRAAAHPGALTAMLDCIGRTSAAVEWPRCYEPRAGDRDAHADGVGEPMWPSKDTTYGPTGTCAS